MRILHLTDLHVHPEIELERLWNGASRIIREPRLGTTVDRFFDFVVVSGDIADKARRQDYAQALAFLRRYIDPLVGGSAECARVIIVPGNHDVDWESSVGAELSDADQQSDERRAEFRKNREASVYRFETTSAGTLGRGYTIDRSTYNERFGNFQNFLNEYYGDALNEPHRAFNLRAAADRNHWSAHVFDTEGVSFYGINTCSHTDRYASGARLTAKALEALTEHMTKHPTELRVAVWHHGLSAQRGERDFLTTEELGFIVNKGFTLGMHGHTHQDEQADLWDRFREHFPVIATGSFSADAAQLPNVSNQFSILDLEPTHVSWKTYEFVPAKAQWRTYAEKFYSLMREQTRAINRRNCATSHVREISISESGIATLSVHLQGLRHRGQLPLARLAPGYTSSKEVGLKVLRRGMPINAAPPKILFDDHEYSLAVTNVDAYDEIHWECQFSNGYAVDGMDTLFGLSRSPLKSLQEGEDTFLHYVAIDVEKLTLRLKLPPGSEVVHYAPCAQHLDGMTWIDVYDARTLEKCTTKLGERSIEFNVRHPIPGDRYGIRYKLAAKRPRHPPGCFDCLNGVLELCRSARSREIELSKQLTSEIEAVCREVLLDGSDEAPFFVGRLWSESTKSLLPAFGRFAPETWGASFRYGAGVAGHAFRFRTVACWHQIGDSASEEQAREAFLIYQDRSCDGEHTPRTWIIEVPLLLNEQLAVGTIGFADARAEQGNSPTMADFASRIAQRHAVSKGKRRPPAQLTQKQKQLNRFSELASRRFWEILSESHSFARDVLSEHWPTKKRSA